MAISINIDDEWANFISSGYNNNNDDDISDEEEINEIINKQNEELLSANISMDLNLEAP
jgi:hypothetical protein